MDELESKILNYRPSAEAKELLRDCPLLLLVGSAGSGKNTLENELIKTGRFESLTTHTSRAPRSNNGIPEQEGLEYHFITKDQALRMLDEHQFIEAAYTHGNLYGTSVTEFVRVKNEGKIGVGDIDVKGIRSYRQTSNNLTAVFILPPSFKVLISRLKARYGASHDQEELKIRLKTALDEFNELLITDYYYALINDNLEETLKSILDIAEGKLKVKSNPEAMELAKTLIADSQKYLENH